MPKKKEEMQTSKGKVYTAQLKCGEVYLQIKYHTSTKTVDICAGSEDGISYKGSMELK